MEQEIIHQAKTLDFYVLDGTKPQNQLQNELQIIQNLLINLQNELENLNNSPQKPELLKQQNYLNFRQIFNLFFQNQYRQMETLLTHHIEQTPYYSPYYFILAYYQENVQKLPQSTYLQNYQKCLDHKPTAFHVLSIFKLAEQYQFDYKRIQIYKKITQIQKNFIDYEPFYLTLLQKADWINLISGSGSGPLALEKALYEHQQNPQDLEVCYLLIRIYQRLNDYKQCQVYSQKCLNIDPNCVKALYFKAYCLEELAESTPDYNQILQIYKQTLKIDKTLVNSYVSLANIYNTQNDYHKSKDILFEALELFPEESFVLIYIGNYQMLTQQYEEAIESYKKAVELCDHNPIELYINLGQYYEHTDEDKSVKFYVEMISKGKRDLMEKIQFPKIKQQVQDILEASQSKKFMQKRYQNQLLSYYQKFYFTPYFRKDIHNEIIDLFLNSDKNFDDKKNKKNNDNTITINKV